MRFRHGLWDLGLGIAEAWTPPSGGWAWMGRDREVARRTLAEASVGRQVVVGIATDALATTPIWKSTATPTSTNSGRSRTPVVGW